MRFEDPARKPQFTTVPFSAARPERSKQMRPSLETLFPRAEQTQQS